MVFDLNKSENINKLNELNKPLKKANFQFYGHNANDIPPFVLDALSRAHFKEGQLITSNQDKYIDEIKNDTKELDNKRSSFLKDPYLVSVNNNWRDFFKSIEEPADAFNEPKDNNPNLTNEYNLNDPWGGHERLKKMFCGVSSSLDESSVLSKKNFFYKFFCHNKNNKNLPQNQKNSHSKSYYWISEEKKASISSTINNFLLKNLLVPLLFRLLVIIFSLCSLGLSCSLYIFMKYKFETDQLKTTLTLIIMTTSFSAVYLFYLIYDEYNGKPLGLRNPFSKMKLIMLDLLFIIFLSATLSLSCNIIKENYSLCQLAFNDSQFLKNQYDTNNHKNLISFCLKIKILAAFLFIDLLFMVITFSISVIRLVERVSTVDSRKNGFDIRYNSIF